MPEHPPFDGKHSLTGFLKSKQGKDTVVLPWHGICAEMSKRKWSDGRFDGTRIPDSLMTTTALESEMSQEQI